MEVESDESDSWTDATSVEEGIFDDVEGEVNDNDAANERHIQALIDGYARTKGTIEIESPMIKISQLRRAYRRRRRREEEREKLRDPEQFDDTDVTIPGLNPRPNGNGKGRRRNRIASGASSGRLSPPDRGSLDDSMASGARSPIDMEGDEADVPFSRRSGSDDRSRRSELEDDNDDKQVKSSFSLFEFNEKKIFSLPTFKPGVKEAALERFSTAIAEPLKRLEDHGYEAYRQYIEDEDDEIEACDENQEDGRKRKYNRGLFRSQKSGKWRNKGKTEAQKEKSIRSNLQEALVNGDPREYQRRIFEVAKQRNTIVNLGTGAGKTMIALLLIREMWSKSSASSKNSGKNAKDKKQALFLVPSVALAMQQSLTIEANLPHLKVETACYAKNTGGSKNARTSLVTCDVIVATHGAIHDLLMHYGDKFSMDGFCLVVIDECHYAASGKHAYRYLMEKFYQPLKPEKRPRILGLTASPLLNVKEHYTDKHLTEMVDNLEKILDSKLVSAAGLVTSNEEDTNITSAKKNNLLRRVIDEQELMFRGTNMHRTIPTADNLDLLPSRHREFRQLEHLYQDLGPLVVSIYCSVLRRELSKNFFESESARQFDCTLDHIRRIEDFCNQEIKVLPNMGRNDKLLALEELVETLIEENGSTKTIGLVFVQRRITALALYSYFNWRSKQVVNSTSGKWNQEWKSAREARKDLLKLEKLFALRTSSSKIDQSDDENDDDQFEDSIDDPFHVFERKRQASEQKEGNSSSGRNELLGNDIDTSHRASQFMDAEGCSGEAETKRKDYGRVAVKSVALVRNPVNIFKSLSITYKTFTESEQASQYDQWVHRESNIRDVLSRLRNGHSNLMFATSVVEEGVDVQACSFVVALDDLNSIKGYIQMKGRARNQNAKFFAFRDPHDNRESKLELSVAQNMERRIDQIIEQRMGSYAPTINAMSSHVEAIKGVSTDSLSKEIAAIESGMYKVGGATVDIQSAKSLLNRYFTSVPLDPFVRSKKESLLSYMPCFESNRLVLPVHLPCDIRTVLLPDKYSNHIRREKEKMLSLMACVRLHCYGLLNDRLLPLARRDMQSQIIQAAIKKIKKVESAPLELGGFYKNEGQQVVTVYRVNEKSNLLSKYRDKLNGKGHSLALVTTEPIKTMTRPLTLHHIQFGEVEISVEDPTQVICSNEEFDILRQIFPLLFNSRWGRKSRNLFFEMRKEEEYNSVIMPYLVGLLSSNGKLDWDFMTMLIQESKRSEEERTRVAHSMPRTDKLPQPRVWYTSYNPSVRYIVYGPSGRTCGEPFHFRKEGCQNHVDYFKKTHALDFEPDCPLFLSHVMWTLPFGIYSKKTQASVKDPTSLDFDLVEIPREAFVEEPLANAHIASLCLFLPQFLFMFEKQQTTEAFIKHCEAHMPTLGNCLKAMDFDRVTLAMTSKGCNPDENYETLEWLGDAVLKLLQTDSILRSPKFKHLVRFLHEGELSMLRSAMGTNERLKEICTQLCLEEFVLMKPLSRGRWSWSPSSLQARKNDGKEDEYVGSMKIFADVIESILGIIYLEFGYHVAMKVGNELRVTLPWEETDESVACGETGEVEDTTLVDIVGKCTGHKKEFNRPKLVTEAFTHPTVVDASVPSYQRLEWIGDAVLCLCTREWLLKNINEDVNLGDLVMLEGALVSNETLGFLSVKHGLQQYLNHRDQSLPKRIESYCWTIHEGCGFWGGDPPKPIADIVEAILGAIHVDGGFEAGQSATLNLMSCAYSVVTESLEDGASKFGKVLKEMKHPKKALQEMTGQLCTVMVCSEHEFASRLEENKNDESEDLVAMERDTSTKIPQILHKDEWRYPVRGNDSCYVSFISMLGHPLIVVADDSINVARNRASSLAREAIEQNPDLEDRIATCRSNIETGLTAAIKRRKLLE